MLNDLLTYNSYPWIIYIYFFNWLVIIWRQGEGFIWTWASKDKDVERVCRQMDKELGGLENWKIFMDVICVLSLRWKGINYFRKTFHLKPNSHLRKIFTWAQVSTHSFMFMFKNYLIVAINIKTYVRHKPSCSLSLRTKVFIRKEVAISSTWAKERKKNA